MFCYINIFICDYKIFNFPNNISEQPHYTYLIVYSRKTWDTPTTVEKMLVFALSDMYSYFKSCVLSQRERKMGITITRHTLRYIIIIILLWCHVCVCIIFITYVLLQLLLLSYNGKFLRSSIFMDRGPLPFLGLIFDDVHMHPFTDLSLWFVYSMKIRPLEDFPLHGITYGILHTDGWSSADWKGR